MGLKMDKWIGFKIPSISSHSIILCFILDYGNYGIGKNILQNLDFFFFKSIIFAYLQNHFIICKLHGKSDGIEIQGSSRTQGNRTPSVESGAHLSNYLLQGVR